MNTDDFFEGVDTRKLVRKEAKSLLTSVSGLRNLSEQLVRRIRLGEFGNDLSDASHRVLNSLNIAEIETHKLISEIGKR
jgi:hypothetical protein